MIRAKGNGLVELVDEKDDGPAGFFCTKLAGFINRDDRSEEWDGLFAAAKGGSCAYRGECPIYARTMEKRMRNGVQLQLDFV